MFHPKRVLVAGDLMVDTYTVGEVVRISPEAPVPVVKVVEEEQRPGGAGNVMLNLLSLGMKVRALGRTGQGLSDDFLRKSLRQEGVETEGLFLESHFSTPRKMRILASGQQIVRVDYETTPPLSPELEEKVRAALPALLEEVDIITVSDYAKGFLTPSLLATLIAEARARAIPLLVDPKGRDFSRYKGATLLKPNVGEAILAAGLSENASLDAVAARLFAITDVDTLVITRAKEGISLFSHTPHLHRDDHPTHARTIKDVTGAGDTVLAILTAALANQLSLAQGAKLANYGAGLAVERMGCARISASELSSLSEALRAHT